MPIAISTPSTYVDVLDRILERERGDLSPAAARAFLEFSFAPEDRERMQELALKAQEGTLSRQEQIEINNYEFLGLFLDILHAKGRLSLKKARTKSK